MKTKNFYEYLKKRLDKNEINEIEKQARLEVSILKSLQEDVANALSTYMSENKIGFNELVKKLDTSPSQISKIQRGEANLTLATIAHLFALIKKKPAIVFNSKDNLSKKLRTG